MLFDDDRGDETVWSALTEQQSHRTRGASYDRVGTREVETDGDIRVGCGDAMSRAGVLVERTFEVDVPADRAWVLLADVARWPEWAPHITSASVDPPGPVGPTSQGVFRFRPMGRGAFKMTAWHPPGSWTWTGRAMGVAIEYDHDFEPIDASRSRLRWVVRSARGKRGLRARLFAMIYSRLIDRAWPRFARWAAPTDPRDKHRMLDLTSSAFEDSQEIPQKHGKKIENVSPQLSWTGAPEGTRSFAISVVDRHPVAGNYIHWLVVDIGPVTSLLEGAAGSTMPAGSREVTPYAGPFPPSGTHDYEFTLYALKTDRVEMPKKVSLDAFVKAVEPHTLATGTLVGKFTKVRA